MAKGPKELSGITTEPERFWLRVDLTDEEKMNAAQASAKAVLQHGILEDQLTEIKAKFKADLEAQQALIKKNSKLVEDGYEYRDVDCEWEKDWSKGVKRCRRLDTREIFKDNVKIEPSERQSELAMVKKQ